MDTNMRKPAVIAISLILLSSASACSNVDYQHEVKVDGAKGKFYISKSGTTTPLSEDKDIVDYKVGSKNLRIFTGYGGKAPVLYFDKTQNLLIISYCEGRIDSVESSFSDTISTDGENWRIYRTQVINNSGFAYGGAPICP